MAPRIDAAIYREALAELRDKYREEFEEIRQRRLAEAGLWDRKKSPRGITDQLIKR